MRTTFSFESRQSDHFGTIYRPMITVQLWSNRYRQWQKVAMLMDTGADFTILPRYVGVLLGIEVATLPVMETLGLGGVQKVSLMSDLKLKIGSAQRTVPVGFLPQSKAPALLGRHLCLETFEILLKGRKEVVFEGSNE